MGLITKGVMSMPLPDDPADLGIVEWLNIKSRMRDAGAMIDKLELENEELKTAMPDEIDLYRIIKASGERSHAGIAKAIAKAVGSQMKRDS